jgi:hypothetical protein
MSKTLAVVFGVVFVLVGVLGFVPNPIVGLEGIFETDLLHNIVHILLGALLFVASSKGEGASAMCIKIVGAVYLVLAILGFLMPDSKLLGLVEANQADTWLHLGLGLVLVAVGMMVKKENPAVMPSMPS